MLWISSCAALPVILPAARRRGQGKAKTEARLMSETGPDQGVLVLIVGLSQLDCRAAHATGECRLADGRTGLGAIAGYKHYSLLAGYNDNHASNPRMGAPRVCARDVPCSGVTEGQCLVSAWHAARAQIVGWNRFALHPIGQARRSSSKGEVSPRQEDLGMKTSDYRTCSIIAERTCQ